MLTLTNKTSFDHYGHGSVTIGGVTLTTRNLPQSERYITLTEFAKKLNAEIMFLVNIAGEDSEYSITEEIEMANEYWQDAPNDFFPAIRQELAIADLANFSITELFDML